MPGFGRGPPLPGAPPRGAPVGRCPPPGRDGTLPGPAGAPGPAWPPGRCAVDRGCAGWPTPKGLFPTRGARGPGRGVAPGRPSPGRDPRAGDGRGASPLGAAAGRCSAAGRSAGRRSAAGRSAGRRSAAGRSAGRCSAAGRSAGGAGRNAGSCGGGVGAGGVGAGAAGRAGPGFGPAPGRAGLAGAPLPLPADGNESRSLRATGASTVEDADFTNSPRSLSLLRTSLLVTPSSFASSCTRALPATGLLTVGAGGVSRSTPLLAHVHGLVLHGCGYMSDRPALVGVHSTRVSRASGWVVLRGPGSTGARTGVASPGPVIEVSVHRRGVERSLRAQSAGEGPAPLGGPQALGIAMQPGTASREPSTGIGDHGPLHHHHAQQSGGRLPCPAPHTHPDRIRARVCRPRTAGQLDSSAHRSAAEHRRPVHSPGRAHRRSRAGQR